ncbi:MAG: RNA polymerase sigma-70 factor [Rhodothermales bacterium]
MNTPPPLHSMLHWFGLLVSLAITGREGSEDLVERLREGSAEAFRSLFDLYHTDLYRFLVRSGVPEEAAEDILQDVFAGVWSGRSRLDPSRSIRAYLYRSCRNRSANYFRSRARFSDEILDDPVSPHPSQEDRLDHAALLAHLAEAVSELPERRRAVFELCFMSGLSYKEAADILKITPKTVENQMGYAFKAVRERLAPYVHDE